MHQKPPISQETTEILQEIGEADLFLVLGKGKLILAIRGLVIFIKGGRGD
jgi:hypothetical protein